MAEKIVSIHSVLGDRNMDIHRILNVPFLRFVWIADPKWHSVIVAGFSIISLLLDLLFSGKRSIFRIMKRLKYSSNDEIPDFTNLRFCYLYHYYANRTAYNYGWLLYSKVEDIRKAMTQVQVLGLDSLQQALNSDKGIIAFSAHVGCFFNPLFCERITKLINGRNVALLSPENKEKRKKLLKNQINATSPSLNLDLIDITMRTDAIKILRTLKKKGIIACTLDYAYGYTRNKEIEFFGRKVDFPIGAIEIGQKIGVTYLPFFSYVRNGQVTIEFLEPFSSVEAESAENDIDAICEKVNNILKTKVLELPEQWSFWLRLYSSAPAN